MSIPPTQRPPLILLLGMHRSGTSLLGSLMAAIGVELPGPLLAADEHNPEGYFERKDITQTQELLLELLGRPWAGASGVIQLPASWLQLPSTQRAKQQLKDLLRQESKRQKGPWAIKDPRCCLLLPLWREICEELEIPLKLLVSVREPSEVVVSLLRRDSATTGMTSWRAQKLWWYHHRQLMLDADPLPLEVVDYGAWFDSSASRSQLERISLFCFGRSLEPAILSKAVERIKPQHRRSRLPHQQHPLSLHSSVRKLHLRLCRVGELSQLPKKKARRALIAWLRQPQQAQLPAIPCHGGSLRSRLIRWRAQLVPTTEPGAWFDSKHYRGQVPNLPRDHDPLSHYFWRGWRDGLSPHPLFDANHYRLTCRELGIDLRGAPLLHFLQQGLEKGIAPHPLALPGWAPRRRELWQSARLDALHPWGAAALSLSNDDLTCALSRLQHWQEHGLSRDDLDAVFEAASGSFEVSSELLPAPTPIPQRCRLRPIGAGPLDWTLHAWLQHLPVPKGFRWSEQGETQLTIFIGPLPIGLDSLNLIELAQQQQIWANDAASVKQLRRLGVPAQLVHALGSSNGWLDQVGDSEATCEQLGLPPVESLTGILSIGTGGPAWERQLAPPVWGWPGFDAIVLETPEHARLLAGWLNRCNRAGLQLVRLEPQASEELSGAWQALESPAKKPDAWLPPQIFRGSLHPAELISELRWIADGKPEPAPVTTPQPEHQVVWSHSTGLGPAAVAVCISLYNYGHCVETALTSISMQSLANIELIIVDDDSNDDSMERCRRWLDQNGNCLHRAVLLRHTQNGGLASARNTAFNAARAAWCFVLDADNFLAPDAVAYCLAIAERAPATTAVVHPLVEVVSSKNGDEELAHPERAFISGISWQRQAFYRGNVIDAMALVRRQAWQQVGGYSHIPGGWEDFDFWCKLIENGWHGVLCPQRLAFYTAHANSMLATETNRRKRSLSRLIQARHHWLHLPLAHSQ